MFLVKICFVVFAIKYAGKCFRLSINNLYTFLLFSSVLCYKETIEVVKVFNQFVCQYGKDIIDTSICCPSQAIKVDEEDNVVGPPPTPSSVENHENLKYLPEECGLIESPGNKIAGGENATLNEFPWMAMLLYGKGDKLVPNCGGSILNENYILTAAHCVVDTPLPFVGVRVGEYSLLSERDCVQDRQNRERCLPPVQHLIPIKILAHKDYNSDSNVNDIALVKVTKINFADNVQPICLPTHEEILNQKFNYGVVTGWGYLDPLKGKSEETKHVYVCICLQDSSPKKVSNNSYNRLCIGGKAGKDSCRGDSGGPYHVAAYFNEEFRYIQRGIVSIGHIECGKKGFPAVYTNVDYYMKWILDNIDA
ncbi:hypothetical protein NQ315_009584 [Exocentrus adspersus]|uniref:Peptidase S1 domain-containing protein n=1 Tax=Exocentrus adspersus TaxID=1586481 RepID=A0AAV8WJ25_9CUCU|nr:hypothetical protein NQ315_009584 [Exocentrus adspersus]